MTHSDIETYSDICPYCGEPVDVSVDLSAGSQRFIEDCSVCCQPIEFHLEMDQLGEGYSISLHRDDE